MVCLFFVVLFFFSALQLSGVWNLCSDQVRYTRKEERERGRDGRNGGGGGGGEMEAESFNHLVYFLFSRAILVQSTSPI